MVLEKNHISNHFKSFYPLDFHTFYLSAPPDLIVRHFSMLPLIIKLVYSRHELMEHWTPQELEKFDQSTLCGDRSKQGTGKKYAVMVDILE